METEIHTGEPLGGVRTVLLPPQEFREQVLLASVHTSSIEGTPVEGDLSRYMKGFHPWRCGS